MGFLALLAYVFVGTSSAGILCFGADGHVAFEQLRDEHPIVRDSAAMGATPARVISLMAGTSRATPHGPCFDVALDVGSQWRAGATTESPHLPLPSMVSVTDPAVVAPLRVANVPRAQAARTVSAGDPALTSLGRTVLRI